MRNFFRELRNCEEAVLSEDALFTNLAGESEPYQESTKKTLCEVISIVSSGMFFRTNSPSYFIVKNFRLGPSRLAALWNEKHPDDRKAESTWRSQVYSVSQKFFRLFGLFCENPPPRCVKHSERRIFAFETVSGREVLI